MKTSVLSFSLAFSLLTQIACNAATAERHVFAPVDCEFSLNFPKVPVVEDRVNQSTGDHALQAQTPGDAFPWILAQCTTGRDGSPPPNVENRLERVLEVLRERGATNIRSSISRDARGSWAKATGQIIVGGLTLTMAVTSVAGESSMLLVSGFMKTSADNLQFERFLAEIKRLPNATSTIK